MQPIIARYTWTADDLLTGRKYVMKTNYGLRLIRATAVVTLILFGFQNQFRKDGVFEGSGGAILFIASLSVGLVIGLLIRKGIVRRQFAKRPDANQQVVWTASDETITVSIPDGRTETKWAAYQKVISTPDGFLFMPNRQAFNFIPTRAFSSQEDIETVKSLARQHATEFKELT